MKDTIIALLISVVLLIIAFWNFNVYAAKSRSSFNNVTIISIHHIQTGYVVDVSIEENGGTTYKTLTANDAISKLKSVCPHLTVNQNVLGNTN
jgi:hypothetical protein